MKKILVIGESCKDIFVYCEALRLAPDVPIPVLNIKDQTANPGMAKNVQQNIASIYPHCDILTNNTWETVTKTRYMHCNSNHAFFRVDSPHEIDSIDLEDVCYDYEIIVISDYNKGFLSENQIEHICGKHDLVFLDTKKVLGSWAKDAAFIKINDYEYNRSKEFLDDHLRNKIIHTQGGEGCTYQGIKYPVDKVDVKDTSGAGDSFMAALVVKYIQSSNIQNSIQFANKCASKVVKKKGVTVI